MSSRWLTPSGPYDTVEEPLDSGGHLAKDLHGARRRTLDVHAVVGARHSEFSTTIKVPSTLRNEFRGQNVR